MQSPGTLYVVATPIGNLEDITLRALRVLREEVAAIACEDTRQTQKLLSHFEIRKPLISYHEHNEASRTAEILVRLERGESIALVSDAGTPLISDPGYRVVQAAVANGFAVVPIPGASAALAALAASGLPADEFLFIGFLPGKAIAREKKLQEIARSHITSVVYESPHRILATLADMQQILGERQIVLARELTKIHEEFLRGTALEMRHKLAEVRGEITLVISPAEPQAKEQIADPAAEVARLESEGLDRMQAIKTVAKRTGLPKREVYQKALGSNPRGKRRDSDRKDR